MTLVAPKQIKAGAKEVRTPSREEPEEIDVLESPLANTAQKEVDEIQTQLAKEATAKTLRNPPSSPVKKKRAVGTTSRRLRWDRPPVTDPRRGVDVVPFATRDKMPVLTVERPKLVKLKENERQRLDGRETRPRH
jgi:hypothetical protein